MLPVTLPAAVFTDKNLDTFSFLESFFNPDSLNLKNGDEKITKNAGISGKVSEYDPVPWDGKVTASVHSGQMDQENSRNMTRFTPSPHTVVTKTNEMVKDWRVSNVAPQGLRIRMIILLILMGNSVKTD